MGFKFYLFIVTALFLFSSVSFSQSRGHFIANTINAAGSRDDRNNIYDKLSLVSYEYQKMANNMWAQAGYENLSLGGDGNSEGSFNSDTGVISFGYGREVKNDISIGFFGNYKNHSMSQAGSGADVNSYGIGAYGGYLYEEFDFKAILSLSGQQYTLSRNTPAGRARSDFNGYGINADFEAAFWRVLSAAVNLRPYAGLNISYTGYGSSSEMGAGSENLETDGGIFTKSVIRTGAAVNGKHDKIGWYGGLELGLIIAGRYAEIESRAAGTGITVKSKGAQTGALALGLNAGGDYDLTRDIKAYSNLNYKISDGLGNFSASLGMVFIFDSF